MLTGWKIVSVKSFSQPDEIPFVKVQTRSPLVIKFILPPTYFQDWIPLKACRECAVGISGFCCHTLARLLLLEHHVKMKEKLLILSCTWQLQNSHRRRAFKIWSWQEIIINSRDAFDDHSSDALRDFGPNTYKRRLNGWRKKRVSQSVCMVFKLLFDI